MLKIRQRLLCEVSGETVTVVKELGSGGQGTVYLVEGKDGKKALKWYKLPSKGPIADDARFKALKELVDGKSPDGTRPDGERDSSFAWPLEMVKSVSNAGTEFGYTMEFVDFGVFIPLSKMMSGKKRFQPDQRTKTLISLNLCAAFAQLHAKGYCYRDINDGNILFDIKTGKVKIVDNDNVGFEGTSKSGVLGVPDYMAPEILRGAGKVLPSKLTDYHSLAVFLFKLWTWHHPLEGRKALEIRCWDRDAKVRVFGDSPLFIFDPKNKLNFLPSRDHGDDFSYVHKMWEACPAGLRGLFTEAFTQGLARPSARVIETRWLKEFAKMYDNLTNCPFDGSENFFSVGEPAITCWRCKKRYDAPICLKIKNVNNNTRVSVLSVKPDVRLFARHMSGAADNIADSTTIIGTVIVHPQNRNVWGLRNDTRQDWVFVNVEGKEIAVPPAKSVPVAKGNVINFDNGRTGEFD